MRHLALAFRAVLLVASANVLFENAPACAAEVLARQGSTEVTLEEMRAYLGALTPAERAMFKKDPALVTSVVRTYLAERVVLAEAHGKRFEEDPNVKARLQQARDRALSEMYLDSVAQPPEGYPSEEEVLATYQGNRPLFVTPRRFRLSQIVLRVPDETDQAKAKALDEKAHHRALELSRKLRVKGADFAAQARAASEEKETAPKGGDLGWLPEGQLPPSILSAIDALDKQVVTDPVRLPDGWHLLKLDEAETSTVRPLAEVRDSIVQSLRKAKAQETRKEYLAKLLGAADPAVNEIELSKLFEEGR